MARGIASKSVADEFLVHSNEEQGHADRIAERIVQLGGEPDFSPEGLSGRSHAEYIAGSTLVEMIKEDLVAERIAIDSYREIIEYIDHDDPTTSRLMKDILAVEEEHADELSDLLVGLPGRRAPLAILLRAGGEACSRRRLSGRYCFTYRYPLRRRSD